MLERLLPALSPAMPSEGKARSVTAKCQYPPTYQIQLRQQPFLYEIIVQYCPTEFLWLFSVLWWTYLQNQTEALVSWDHVELIRCVPRGPQVGLLLAGWLAGRELNTMKCNVHLLNQFFKVLTRYQTVSSVLVIIAVNKPHKNKPVPASWSLYLRGNKIKTTCKTTPTFLTEHEEIRY